MTEESYFRFYPKGLELHGERVDLTRHTVAEASAVESAYDDLRTRWRHVYIYSPRIKSPHLARPVGTFLVGRQIRLSDNEMGPLGYARVKSPTRYREYHGLQQSNTESTI